MTDDIAASDGSEMGVPTPPVARINPDDPRARDRLCAAIPGDLPMYTIVEGTPNAVTAKHAPSWTSIVLTLCGHPELELYLTYTDDIDELTQWVATYAPGAVIVE
jgi:hypothetical protein